MQTDGWLISSTVFVDGFFIISGYLTFNSFIRKPDIKLYVRKRVKRIYPAYGVAILICFIIGICLTELPLAEFFTRSETSRYLAVNLLFCNSLQPTLPGVFEHNALPFMNAALWTMKIEVLFYITVPLVYALINGRSKRSIDIILLSICILAATYCVFTNEMYLYSGNEIWNTLNHQLPGKLLCFYFPVLLLMHREHIFRYGKTYLSASLVCFILFYYNRHFSQLLPVPLSFIIVIVAYRIPLLTWIYGKPDISYEFYLLHFPILQTVICLMSAAPIYHIAGYAFIATLLLAICLHRCLQGPRPSPTSPVWRE